VLCAASVAFQNKFSKIVQNPTIGKILTQKSKNVGIPGPCAMFRDTRLSTLE